MMKDYTIVSEPNGSFYVELLKWCAGRAATLGFTIPVARELSVRAKTLVRACEARGAEGREVTEWPGTILHSGSVLMYTMRAESALDLILNATSDLFSWQEPDLPEDLFFLRADGSPLLTSIAHESDAYLSLEQSEMEDLQQSAPDVAAGLQLPLANGQPAT